MHILVTLQLGPQGGQQPPCRSYLCSRGENIVRRLLYPSPHVAALLLALVAGSRPGQKGGATRSASLNKGFTGQRFPSSFLPDAEWQVCACPPCFTGLQTSHSSPPPPTEPHLPFVLLHASLLTWPAARPASFASPPALLSNRIHCPTMHSMAASAPTSSGLPAFDKDDPQAYCLIENREEMEALADAVLVAEGVSMPVHSQVSTYYEGRTWRNINGAAEVCLRHAACIWHQTSLGQPPLSCRC